MQLTMCSKLTDCLNEFSVEMLKTLIENKETLSFLLISSKKSMSRVTSFASVLSTPMARMGKSLQRSFSGAKLTSESSLNTILLTVLALLCYVLFWFVRKD